MDDMAGEVLYENTGASRYFMRNFTHDIMTYTKPEDLVKVTGLRWMKTGDLPEDIEFTGNCCLNRRCIV